MKMHLWGVCVSMHTHKNMLFAHGAFQINCPGYKIFCFSGMHSILLCLYCIVKTKVTTTTTKHAAVNWNLTTLCSRIGDCVCVEKESPFSIPKKRHYQIIKASSHVELPMHWSLLGSTWQSQGRIFIARWTDREVRYYEMCYYVADK